MILDKRIRAMLCQREAYVVAVDATALVQRAKEIHGLSKVCTAALGRVLMGALLCAADLKYESGDVTLSFHGDGPAGRCIAVATPQGTVRGYLDNPTVELPPNAVGKLDVRGALGSKGRLAVMKDTGGQEPYVGQVNLCSGEVAEDLAMYFAVSEQTPCLVYLGVHVDAKGNVEGAAGLLAYPLPGCPDEVITTLEGCVEGAQRLSAAIAEKTPLEKALSDVFASAAMEITQTDEIEYRCTCSRERMERALISLGEQELMDIITQDGKAQVRCHFCNTEYNFTKEELNVLLMRAKSR